MQARQLLWTKEDGWSEDLDAQFRLSANLVLAFSSRELLATPGKMEELKELFPNAHIAACSTSGEILSNEIHDDSIAVTAMWWQKTPLEVALVNVQEFDSSLAAGKKLAERFDIKDLKHLFVLSDGQLVNGTELVEGISQVLPESVTVTGGLAGDADRFEETLVGLNETPQKGVILAVGFYGDRVRVGYGSNGGWEPFGPVRTITSSKDNVLYQLDGKNALDIYKTYLGDQAKGLPSTGLLFPLAIQSEKAEEPLVRTILGVDEQESSMTFAGNMPEKARVQLMRANFDKLVDGAQLAAEVASKGFQRESDVVAVLVSCVGRRLVLSQRTEEELEEVRDCLGEDAYLTGFYSYGEICPIGGQGSTCLLHNQTMTVTLFSEVV